MPSDEFVMARALSAQLKRTSAKLEALVSVIREVHTAHADDLCWMDIDRIFVAAGLPVPDRTVGDKEAMKVNCARFIDQICAGGK